MPQRSLTRLVLATSLGLALIGLTFVTSGASEAPPRSIVSTIAGNGKAGLAAGDALESSFVMPVGVSVAPDDSILVVDAGANAIYRLSNGRIVRVAGKTGPYNDSQGAAGGYVNGPVASAEFDRPEAALERSDGAIFVADNANHCIRLVQGGNVSTYAGSTTAGAADGDRGSATFTSPTGLAFDAGGNLLVSDFGVGIRRINKSSGEVTTLPLGRNANDILAIAARVIDGHQVIAYTQVRAIHLAVDGKDQTVASTRDRMPDHEDVPVFNGWGIAILNVNTVVVTDVMTSVIRLIRFPVLPFTDVPASEALSSTLHEDTDFNGGFRDGPGTDALYQGPRGIALDSRGRLVIADTGNRRIRRLTGFSARETALPDFSNYAAPAGNFGVVLIGQSYLFNGVLWPDSIPGTVESALARDAPAAGLTRPVHVEGVRADGIGFAAMSSLANDFVEPSANVDTIVFLLTPVTYSEVSELVTEANLLAKSDIKFAVAVLPLATAVSVVETPYKGCGCVPTLADSEADRAEVEELQSAYQRAGLTTIDLLDPMVRSESAPQRVALFNMYDNHLSVAGQSFVGSVFADALLRDRPWDHHAKTLPIEDQEAEHSCPVATAAAGPPTTGHLDIFKIAGAPGLLKDGDPLPVQSLVELAGWASDSSQVKPYRALCVLVDRVSGYPAHGTKIGIRLDIARKFGHRELASSGFHVEVEPHTLPLGKHTVGIGILQADGTLLEEPGAVEVEIK